MKHSVPGLLALALGVLLLTAPAPGGAHHSILGKFDDSRPVTLEGIVTMVDWRSPHVHVFMNVQDDSGVANWAIELEGPDLLELSGWRRDSVAPGDALTIEGIVARDESRQAWGNSVIYTATGREVLKMRDLTPPPLLASRPAPTWPDGQPRLGPVAGGAPGYWAFPSQTAMVEAGVDVEMNADGILANGMDASQVAPLQPWALQLYRERQQRFLADDPMFLHCKPPGGPRQFQLAQGVQFLEDRERERIFVLIGGGNRNFRLIYLDGRDLTGQVGGDDDNPLYYGRSVGEWDDDVLVLETTGFNEDFWFSNGGLPHTSQLRMTERLSRLDFDTLRYEVTIDDPGAYTRPWTTAWDLRWVAGELPLQFCQENRP